MKLFESVGDFFALDIGTSAIRVVELKGTPGSWTLAHYGSVPVDLKASLSDSAEGKARLGEAITSLITQSGITSRNVAVGIPSSKAFVTVVDLPNIAKEEIDSTIKYQAEQYIPMSLEEAKIDWSSLGPSMKDEGKIEVLLASVSNKFSEERLELVESLGLNVVSLEPDPLALVRSLAPADNKAGMLIIDLGDNATDIVATIGDTPRLVRSLPTGMSTLIKAAQQNLNIDENQATQFILKFGLYPDRLEGQIFKALESTLESYVGEINKTVKFFQTRYPNVPLQSAILTGHSVAIPAFSDYVSSKTGLSLAIGNPWQYVHFGADQQQNLMQWAPKFAVAIGLAQRTL